MVTSCSRVTAGIRWQLYCRLSFEKRMAFASSGMLPETEPPLTGVTLPP